MATETIFKVEPDGVKMYRFEKHYITLVLKERIEVEKKLLSDCLADEIWINQLQSQAAVPILKRFISDLETVLERVEVTKEV